MPRGVYCNDPDHLSAKVYGDNLTRKQEEIHRLEAENAALTAQLGHSALPRDSEAGDVLVAFTQALQVGYTHAYPAPHAQVTDHTKTGRQKPKGREPTGGDRRARNTLRWLVRSAESMIETFHNRRVNDWQRTDIDFDEPGPRKRCWTRWCVMYGRTVAPVHSCHSDDVASPARAS